MANIIVFAPHPDDAEIGMGGAIVRLASQGHDVLIADVTDGSPTPRGDRASRLIEAAEALKHLQPSGPGSIPVRRVLLDLRNRFVEHTIATRHLLAGAIRAHQATIIFTPHPEDAHPDHRAVTRAVEDARFDAKLTKIDMPTPPAFASIGPPIYARWLFYYDVSHLRRAARPDFFLDITGFETQKQASIRAYRSQFGPWPDAAPFAAGDPKSMPRSALVTPDFPERMLAHAAHWGSCIGVPYAEPFFTSEPLGLASLDSVVGL